MQQRNRYQKPLIRIMLLQQRHHLLATSSDAGQKPSAKWMEDPDIESQE